MFLALLAIEHRGLDFCCEPEALAACWSFPTSFLMALVLLILTQSLQVMSEPMDKDHVSEMKHGQCQQVSKVLAQP